jgi:D-alanyl-D-alanine carboxypeptidase/D-alanyl-D-alanine-endopeptidase (penicillin-binding protein 4)
MGMKLINTSNYEIIGEALKEYFKSKGIRVDNIFIKDGSGLSRTNMLTTDFLVDMLVYSNKESYFKFLYEVLAVAGVDGTLKNSFQGTSAMNNFRGKTGSMNGVRSYTGYITNKSGDLIAFAVIVNGNILKSYDIRNKLEKLIIALADSE